VHIIVTQVVPNMRTVVAEVEEMILCFSFLQAERADGRTNEAPFCEVVPGEDASVGDKPKESVDFGPKIGHPYFSPNRLLKGGCGSLTFRL
jgi:hypothetical protein